MFINLSIFKITDINNKVNIITINKVILKIIFNLIFDNFISNC